MKQSRHNHRQTERPPRRTNRSLSPAWQRQRALAGIASPHPYCL